jgi:DnaJ family protein C protein 17
VNASQRFAQETEEEAIKEAGRKMREAMQKAHIDSQTPKPAKAPTVAPPTVKPVMTPADLTLTFQFPPESVNVDFLASSTTLEPRITSLYGPVNFVLLKEASGPSDGKKKKARGAKAIVEFKDSNWGGCWACWRDHNSATGKPPRPLVEGTKVKWATKDGVTPDWIAWAETQSDVPLTAPPTANPPPKVSSSFASTFASSFPSAEERRQQEIRTAKADAAKVAADDYESATLFKMRQMERERLEAEIRRQEEEEA